MSTANPLLRQSQPTPPKDNLFSRFGLLENPFPDSPTVVPDSSDPRRNGEIYCDELRLTEESQFERLLIPRESAIATRPIAFLMDYATRRGRGIGKTAFLNHERRRIMRDLGDELTGGKFVVLAAHLVPEGSGRTRKFWQFTRLVGSGLGSSGCVAWALWRLRALSGEIPQHVMDQVDPRNPETTLGNDGWLEGQGVSAMFSLDRGIERSLLQAGVSEEVALSLARYGHDIDQWDHSFLSGRTDHWWRQEGNTFVFNDLVRLFRAAGIDQALLLVDEVEKIVVPQNSQERRAFVDDLRRFFIDGPYQSVYTRFYNVMFTIHPYVQELWTPHWKAAGLDRVCSISGPAVQEYTVYFQPLNAAQTAVPLALAYLDHFRTSPDLRGQLGPFDREAVVKALDLSQGVPGPMLTLLRLVLERAVTEQWDKVTADHVQAIYQTEIPSEPTEENDLRALPPLRADRLDEDA